MMIQGSYLKPVHHERQKHVDKTLRALERHEFDAIAFTGISGAMIAPIVAYLMNRQLICVRKPQDSKHASHTVEGPLLPCRYVIVDDGRSSGKTVNDIEQAIAESLNRKHECVGVYFYLDKDEAPTQLPPRIIGPLDDRETTFPCPPSAPQRYQVISARGSARSMAMEFGSDFDLQMKESIL